MVFGLGTRAVERSDDDYTRIAALNVPFKRPEGSPEDVRKHLEKLSQANGRPYPLRDLVPLRETASQMVDGIVRGIR